MAQRYGGAHSPPPREPLPREAAGEGRVQPGSAPRPAAPYEGARAVRAGARVNVLFLAPLPLAISAFAAEPMVMAMRLGALGLMELSAWLTREGVRAQEAYEARRIARRPAFPRKIFGAVFMGLGLGLAGLAGGSVLNAAIFGVLGAALHLLAFGPDPLHDKGMEGVDTFQTDRVARAVEGAETRLDEMREAIRRTRDRALEARVERFEATVRRMLRTIEDDPRDLTAARKFLTVYLAGARDATRKFADLAARGAGADARADYERLLDDLESGFASKTQALMQDNRTDLDVEIEVLRERLAREGVALKNE